MKNSFYLRPLEERDAPRMLEWLKNEEITKYLQIDGQKKTAADVLGFILQAQDTHLNLHRAVTAADGKYYGTVSLKNIDHEKKEAEYAISLHPDGIGTGAARNATQGMLRLAFGPLGLRRVYLNVMQENVRAIRLYENIGFQYLYSTKVCVKENNNVVLRWYEIRTENVAVSEDYERLEHACLLEFRENGGERGKLVALEEQKEVPFPIARIFYIYGSDSETVRGCHANRNSEFVLINVSGTSRVRIKDGKCERVFTLDRPNTGLYIPRMLWKEMYDFSENSVLLCLSSQPYDAQEYIRDFEGYIKEISKGG